ncbi:extracellular solute-binding protein [Citricoccus sp. SGAir0253]|uniref:extracellular solute-binding protein n=1 Tax=Citricoccus sp. SGAir0253 TaxID=2567881 RepID=UPI0010CCFE07|nr:extracellular solute-binding protein [Citricoccus sp. SGAir0253]
MRQFRRSGGSARRWAGVAVTATAALVIAGCAPADDTPVLTWYTNPDDGGQAEIAQQCTEQAEGAYRIETSVLPNEAASQREQLTRRLAAGDTSMDIMSLDPPFIPELAEPGFLAVPPSDVVEATTKDTLEGALAGATWKDTVVTVPFWANTQLLWYRKSVAQEAGLDMEGQVTWDQLIEAAADQDKEIGVQGARAESMTVWLNALIESAGGHILENPEASADEVRLGLDTDAGRAAAGVISTIGQEGLGSAGLATQAENESMLLFQGDSGSFMVNWPFVWPATNGAVEDGALPADLPDDIGWGLYPAMEEGKDPAPPLGGINLGVGAASEHQDLAWDAVQCIVTPEHQTQYFVTNGNPPSSASAFDDPSVEEKFPMAPVIRDSLDLAKPRPQTPYYNEVSTAIQQRFTPPSSVNPETTPAETGQFIQEVLRGESLL